jgi:hypothetical protein
MLLFRIVSDSAGSALMSYSMGVDTSTHLDNCIGSKPHQEQTAPITTASGLLSQGVERDPQVLRLVRCAPKETNESTLSTTMKTFLSVFAAYVAAGAFGVAFVQTALQSPHQSTHSGTQSYVRVVR